MILKEGQALINQEWKLGVNHFLFTQGRRAITTIGEEKEEKEEKVEKEEEDT